MLGGAIEDLTKSKHYCLLTKSSIHKAAGSLVTGRSLQNGKMSMGNSRTERPPDSVLYGGRPSGGFVNCAVKVSYFIYLGMKRVVRKNQDFM